LRHAAQARRFVIKRQADGVQQGGFPAPVGPVMANSPLLANGSAVKVNFPFAFE
jgi:hypothetical protein